MHDDDDDDDYYYDGDDDDDGDGDDHDDDNGDDDDDYYEGNDWDDNVYKVANLLRLFRIPQISPASTAKALSDKTKLVHDEDDNDRDEDGNEDENEDDTGFVFSLKLVSFPNPLAFINCSTNNCNNVIIKMLVNVI